MGLHKEVWKEVRVLYLIFVWRQKVDNFRLLKMETLSRLTSALPSIHEDDLSHASMDGEQRFRPTRKAIDAELSNPESGGVTWEQMIERLLEIFDSDEVNIDEVEEILSAYHTNRADWKKFAKFDPYKYTRNLVHEGNGKFNLMLLCWLPETSLQFMIMQTLIALLRTWMAR